MSGSSGEYSITNPVTKSPFGNLPFAIAGGLRGGFTRPLGLGFGYGGGKNSPYGEGQGPTGQFINQAGPMVSSIIPGQVNLSNELMSRARSSYGGYQAAIDQFMQQLPGFQGTAAGATAGGQQALDYARTAAEDAFSPLPGRATFQEASRRALAPAREGAAARGMLEGGQAQAGEQSILSDLAFNALQQENANRQGAISGLAGASSNLGQLGANQAQIAALGPEARAAGFQGAGQLGELLRGYSNMPLDAMNNVLGFLTSTQNPNMALLRMVLPSVASQSKGLGVKTAL